MAYVFLLGAGASWGSEPNIETPPLGNKLFDKLHAIGGAAAQIPEEIKAEFRNDFEVGMSKYDEHTNRNLMRFQRELAGYLCSFSPSKDSSYLSLINSLGHKRFVYSSLNYDLLFELAASMLGIKVCYNANSGSHLRLLKIHGSSNFWPQANIQGCSFQGCGEDVSAPIKTLGQLQSLKNARNTQGLAPSMCVYAEGKRVNISSYFVLEQQSIWKSEVLKSSKIFISGAKVHQRDEHVWTTLGKCNADVYYYGFEGDRDLFFEWKEFHKKKNSFFKMADFNGAIHHAKQVSKV